MCGSNRLAPGISPKKIIKFVCHLFANRFTICKNNGVRYVKEKCEFLSEGKNSGMWQIQALLDPLFSCPY